MKQITKKTNLVGSLLILPVFLHLRNEKRLFSDERHNCRQFIMYVFFILKSTY